MVKITLEQALKLFKVDGGPSKASYTTAKREYRKLAKEYHPDAGGSTEDFQLIQQAWDVYENSLSEEPPKSKPKPQLRNLNVLFKQVIRWLGEREGGKISMSALAADLNLIASEYIRVQEWVTLFQRLQYILGNKVIYVPQDLTIKKLEKALENKQNCSQLSSVPLSVYQKLARAYWAKHDQEDYEE